MKINFALHGTDGLEDSLRVAGGPGSGNFGHGSYGAKAEKHSDAAKAHRDAISVISDSKSSAADKTNAAEKALKLSNKTDFKGSDAVQGAFLGMQLNHYFRA